jgi:nicotinate phosphoribosyltransferase
MIYDEALAPRGPGGIIVDPADALHMRSIDAAWPSEELVRTVMKAGKRLGPYPTLAEIQARSRAQVQSLHPAIRRLLNPHVYPVGLERGLHERRTQLILERRLPQPVG